MKIFYLQFKVVPNHLHENFELIEGALASCWIKENSQQAAYTKSKFYIAKQNWDIVNIESFSIEVSKENFEERDIGKEQFEKAQAEGVAIAYVAWAKDRKTIAEPIPINSSYEFSLYDYINNLKQLSNKGRCLHYDNGVSCNEFIKAHSIQKNRSLSIIASKGHVYRLSTQIGSLKKNNGQLTYEKCGINKVSTFLGFCKKHDNELFEPIDNYPLIPTDQQVVLYAYRSLCRELFVKENALKLINSQLENKIGNKAIHDLLLAYKKGTSFGLDNLKIHKEKFDRSLKEDSYSNIRYVIFISKQKPIIAFSGLFYPDFDFIGRKLQNLGNHNNEMQLLSFCSAPMHNNEWAFLFAWHESSSSVCNAFMNSLAIMMHNDASSLSDCLFRLVLTNCENLAISPQWWENLAEDVKQKIIDRANLTGTLFTVPDQFYLTQGLEGIANWQFERVISKMD